MGDRLYEGEEKSMRCVLSRLGVVVPVLLVATSFVSADIVVTGVIRDQDTLAPVADAMVSLQAEAIRTTTAPDGSYTLTIPDVSGSVIVAGKKGYFYRSITYFGTPTGLDINIQPVPHHLDRGRIGSGRLGAATMGFRRSAVLAATFA